MAIDVVNAGLLQDLAAERNRIVEDKRVEIYAVDSERDPVATGAQGAIFLHGECDIVDVGVFDKRHILFSYGPRPDCVGLTGLISPASADR